MTSLYWTLIKGLCRFFFFVLFFVGHCEQDLGAADIEYIITWKQKWPEPLLCTAGAGGLGVFLQELRMDKHWLLNSQSVCVCSSVGVFDLPLGADCFCAVEVESAERHFMALWTSLSTSQRDRPFSVPLNIWVKKLIKMSVWIYPGSSRPAWPVEEKERLWREETRKTDWGSSRKTLSFLLGWKTYCCYKLHFLMFVWWNKLLPQFHSAPYRKQSFSFVVEETGSDSLRAEGGSSGSAGSHVCERRSIIWIILLLSRVLLLSAPD